MARKAVCFVSGLVERFGIYDDVEKLASKHIRPQRVEVLMAMPVYLLTPHSHFGGWVTYFKQQSNLINPVEVCLHPHIYGGEIFTHETRIKTVIHEIGHGIAMLKTDPYVDHGNPWKHLVSELGGEPSEYHNLPLGGAGTKTPTGVCCVCGATYYEKIDFSKDNVHYPGCGGLIIEAPYRSKS